MTESTLERLFEETVSEEKNATVAEQLRAIRQGKDDVKLPSQLTNEEISANEAANLFVLVAELNFPQKLKLALYGNRVARSILVRETERRIPLYVLQNPRITEDEVLEVARNTSVDSSLFRAINNNPSWLKNPQIKSALVSNPKVPLDITLPLVKYLHDKELRRLAKAKSISHVITAHCRKILEKRHS